MNEERVRRVGHNEALYRQVNEQIDRLHEGWGATAGEFVVICECGDLECMEQIAVQHEVYEQTRADGSRFILKPGHEKPDVETVVEDHGDFFVIAKLPSLPSRIAEETDPRS